MTTFATDCSTTGAFDALSLYELTQAVGRASNPDEIFGAALTCLSVSLGVERSSVLLFDDDGVMRFKAWRGLSDGYRGAIEGHPLWKKDTRARQPVLVPDVRHDPDLAELAGTFESEGIGAMAFVPLAFGTRLGMRLLGNITLYYDAPHQFDAPQVLIAQTIAAHTAFALEQHQQRESAARYRGLIDALGLAVYTTDKSGRITFFNDEAQRLWGRAPVLGEELWCGSWRIYHLDGTRMAHDECPMAQAVRRGRPIRGVEIIVERPDGTRATILPYPTPLHDASGRISGAVNILVDVTQQRDVEERLRHANAVKDEFLSLVSHEIKTPITTIVGNAEILNRRGLNIDDDARSGALKDILDEGRRLHGIIDNLLVIARLDRGVEIEMDLVLVERVAATVVDAHRKKHPKRQISLQVLSSSLCVEVNQGYLEQILENLLSNAEKYSPRDCPIEVTIESAGDFVAFRVLDRGDGVDEQERDHIFTPFYRSPLT
ncbi:MAG TPA: histidine kinase dimerization/phospho-acceptor domain-containing protein, partial [Dehalococcoidia bacterium]